MLIKLTQNGEEELEETSMSDKDKTEKIITQIVHAFNGVSGIDAIVLGGSRATGTASENSDIDIGIYYDEATLMVLL